MQRIETRVRDTVTGNTLVHTTWQDAEYFHLTLPCGQVFCVLVGAEQAYLSQELTRLFASVWGHERLQAQRLIDASET